VVMRSLTKTVRRIRTTAQDVERRFPA
jgi:hypothetical protein